ncbi:DUF502 domain-containing protein [Natrarchaeobius chitinivorans]|uniref:DUF502 domain-containing protein n=1 Tax=Natrarchaeobius chitinivorans TaxID=1679083 RepID=A0A3N6P4Z6_NATCH|nr:DUF502 domain-containing protein [Natrarchaeobius chitinivorans]RQG90565.1 DUF502 domain-containing protein [Natrarchaeobius chitinivorans]
MTPTATTKRWLLNGIAITIPLVVTVIVLTIVLEFVLRALSPIVSAIIYVWPNEPPTIVVQLTTLLSLVGLFLLVGFVADCTSSRRLSQTVHETIESIPVVSPIYASVRRASDVLADDETDQFREVKLVEFPHENLHALGFLTADTPREIERRLGEDELQTVMIPLGPNPTTNGFVVHVPVENVSDVDMTVEDAIRSIATLGVATEVENSDDTDRIERSTPFASRSDE